MKKLLVTLGILFGLILVGIITLPFVVDVDSYRPEIVRLAEEQINGKVEIGKLKLSLWGRILVKIDGLKLSDVKGGEILQVKDAAFHLPLASILRGTPEIRLRMLNPEVWVRKLKSGKLNVLTLVKKKKDESQSGSPATPSSPRPVVEEESSGTVELPSIALAAKLGFELKDANVEYLDRSQSLKNRLSGFNVLIQDLSLSETTKLRIWADLNTVLGKTLQVKGPFEIDGRLKPSFENSEFQSAALKLEFRFDDLDIVSPGVFRKSPDVPMNAEIRMAVTPRSLLLESASFTFFNASFSGVGIVRTETETPVVEKLEIKAKPIKLASWQKLIPALKDYDLGGFLDLDAKALGPISALNYWANVKLTKASASSPKLLSQPKIDAELGIKTNQISRISASIRAPGTQININGNLKDFKKPKLVLKVSSPSIDVDQLVDLKKPENKSAPKNASAPKTAPAKESKPVAGTKTQISQVASKPQSADKETPIDQSLAPLRENEMLRSAEALIKFSASKIKAMDIQLRDVSTQLSFKNLQLILHSMKLRVFDGSIDSSAKVALNKKTPSYQFKANIADLNVKKAVESQLKLFKDTLVGKLSLKMSGKGKSLDPDPAKKNLDLVGNMRMGKATFATVDIGRMTTEAINQSIDRVAKKVPQLKGKKVKSLPNREMLYKEVKSSFSMKNGKFSAPDFRALAEPNRGLDIEGTTSVGILDQTINAKWKIRDTYNLTKARDLSVSSNGVKVDHILAKRNAPVTLPVSVGCKLTQPCYSYTEVPGHLANVALSNVADAVKSKATAEVKQKAKKTIDQVRKKAPKEVKNLLKKFGF